ncbi:NHLM bacteriocin system secretion protein [Synechococcus sp. BIOS-U3-1]|uniref:HlyD family efflux transporter periplasmic adaptor subunit n=1 Tax=Synechococcus sp. BIOS-U3-1 TaxID=1400865 RepID=UPI00164676CE|nr:HlyD family efflux transporter periplasmic adaptor subunit [Synechococcus sp. BIOS-U3-1]QNI59527.1 NHLM bacteriocin system secretion protein [Synechococcus sp. BIOS-U3-1]|tara:strand:+ start:1729 stop:2850 length:1122 start_codon:yes stop_codon:yes gene_type:complete
MSLFRKNALDALSSPEKLDQPLRLLRPGQWLLLLSLGGFCLTIGLWSVFGRLPVRISGKGVLIRSNSLTVVQSETAGRILELNNAIGDCVKRGKLMARIDPVTQEMSRKEAEIQLEQLISQDLEEDALGAIRVRQQKAQIARIEKLARSGGIPLDDLARQQRELSSLIYSLASQNGQRQQHIKQQQARIKARSEEINRIAQIRAPINGCVIDRNVHRGEVVQPASTLFTLDAGGRQSSLESLAFFSPGDGKRLKAGQRVRISPSSTKRQRHGGIEGQVLSIRRLPVNDQALIKRLGLESLLDAVRQQPKGPLIEVKTSLKRDPSTISGYDWGGGPGPAIEISTGTPTEVRVLVEERRPISYVIPILRDLTGVY